MIDIPNYEIGKLTGRGGVAEVYLATHVLLDRTVAIKLISPSETDELADKRFLKEAKVVAGLRHPNIVSIYDVGIHENKYYIIMEFLEGGDLKQHIKRGLSISQSIDIIKQISSALAHAHDKGFIHRDIKSQNIMFRADGTAVLTDFGIVKDLAADTGYTVDGTSIGTPHYMSPEQAQGSTKVDWRTDIYSLGVTFYEMLTGELPYNADSPIAVALKHIKDPVPELPEHLAQFQSIIDKSMAKTPEDRFQSLNDMLRAIYTVEGGDMPTQTIEQELLRHRQQNRPVKFVIAAVAVALVAGAAFFAKPYLIPLITDSSPAGKTYSDRSGERRPDKAMTQNQLEVPTAPEASSGAAETQKPVGTSDAQEDSVRDATPQADNLPDPPDKPLQAMDAAFLKNAILQKQYSEALAYIDDARGKMAAAENEMLREADAFLDAGKWINAGDLYNTVLSIEPDNEAARFGLLYVAIQKQQDLENRSEPRVGEHEALLAILDKAIEYTDSQNLKRLKVNTVETLYDSATNQYEKGQLTDADALAQAGLNYAPDHLRLKILSYRIKARISHNEDRWTSPENNNAVAYYQKILQLDPNDADARQGIDQIVEAFRAAAMAALENENFDKAVYEIQKARSIDPDRHELKIVELLIFGDMHYARQEFTSSDNENAAYYYRTVLELAPDNQKAKRRLAAINVLGPLQEIKQTQDFDDKITTYKTVFVNMAVMLESYGSGDLTTNLTKAVIDQIKSDIQQQKDRQETIPAEFADTVLSQFPELKTYIANAQYEILLAKGDNAPSKSKSAEFYLKALELDTDADTAKQRIKKIAGALNTTQSTAAAKSILKQAMAIHPDDAALKDMYQSITQVENARSEINRLLTAVKQVPALEEKTVTYEKLFTELQSAIAGYGTSSLADLQKAIRNQVEKDVERHRQLTEIIPPPFLVLVRQYFPEISQFVTEAQYDILMAKGQSAADGQQKARYCLEALEIHPERDEIRDRIVETVKQLDKNGHNTEAVSTLKQAINIVPNHYEFLVLLQNVQRILEIFPTSAGCSREHLISEASVSNEKISFCVQYMNLDADSIVNVVISTENGPSMEIPVVLNGRSGRKLIDVDAPIEGFTVGTYFVAVKRNTDVLSETRIKFTPQRR